MSALTLNLADRVAPLEFASNSARSESEAVLAVRLFGLTLANISLSGAAEELLQAAVCGRRLRVAFPNAHAVNHAAKDPRYARVLASADQLYADGSGIAVAARLAGAPLRDNVNGTDLFELVAARAAAHQVSLYLLGGRPGVAERAAAALCERHPGLVIAGIRHGYFDHGTTENERVIDDINRSGAGMLLVGLGVPTQDLWLARHRDVLAPPVIAGVGGLFDFYSGRIPRAPLTLRRLGLEWTYRLWQEPRRMWQRYLLGNARFLLQTAVTTRRHRRGDAFLRSLGHVTNAVDRSRAWLARHLQPVTRRAMDVTGAAAGLAFLLPVLALTALAIKLDSDGPVFYGQTRVGLNGRSFRMWKFRSMQVNADCLHAQLQGEASHAQLRFKAKHDPRVTRVGRLIRRFSVDELPQLWNVLIGDMALVGPRPALPSEVARYCPSDRERLLVKPGLTCSWQVSGRADIDFAGQVELDRAYIRRATLLDDLILLLRTPMAVLSARGAY